MASTILTWVAASGPWTLGFFAAFFLARSWELDRPNSIIMAAAGGLTGYLAICGLVAISFKIGFYPFEPIHAWSCVLLGSLGLLFGLWKCAAAVRHLNGLSLALLTLLSLYVAYNAWQATLLPTFGWDVVWYWAVISKKFIDHEFSEAGSTWPIDESDYVSEILIHPYTLSLLGAWAAWLRDFFGAAGPTYAPWFFVWLTMLITVTAHSYALTRNQAFSLSIAIILASTPLLNNHAMIAGYAEVFIAATIVSSVAILTIGQHSHEYYTCICGLLLLISCAAYKNIGYLYTLAVVAAFILFLLVARAKKCGAIRRVVTILMAVALISAFSFFSLVPEDGITVGTRILRFDHGYAGGIFRNELYSKMINQSFHVAFVPILIAIVCIFLDRNSPLLFTALTVAALYTMLIIGQLSEYGFSHAIPKHDTGNTRFSIIFVCCSFLLAPIYFTFAAPTKESP